MQACSGQSQMNEMYEQIESHFYGKYRGLVVENEDGEKRGRLKVVVPAVMGTQEVWALPCAPYAGDGVGFFALPEVGTGVWIEFEAGDVSFPIWTGCFWGDNQIPAEDAKPTVKFFRTEKFTLRVDDEAGELFIEVDGGSTIKITANAITQESSTIKNRAGGKKTVLTRSSFNVHDGAFKVV